MGQTEHDDESDERLSAAAMALSAGESKIGESLWPPVRFRKRLRATFHKLSALTLP